MIDTTFLSLFFCLFLTCTKNLSGGYGKLRLQIRLNNPQLLSYAIVTKNVENLTCVFGLLRPLVYDVYSMQINRGE